MFTWKAFKQKRTVLLTIGLVLASFMFAAESFSYEKIYATGIASYYGKQHHGRKTACGERFNMYGLTAAHKKLPFGTKVKVTNMKNGNIVYVTINDRGPYAKGRIIDLSVGAAQKLGMTKSGTAKVTVEIVEKKMS